MTYFVALLRRNFITLLVCASYGTLVTIPAAALAEESAANPVDGDLARGKAWFTTCAGCHGNAAEGLAVMNAPRLAGLNPTYILRQMMHYRADTRGGASDFYGVMMNGRAKALPTDQAVKDVVAYIATLPKPVLGGSTVRNEAGKLLYETCAACHGDSAEGVIELEAPSLLGLEADYIARNLSNFKSGVRGAHPDDILGAQMRDAAMLLENEKAIRDISEYIASLPKK